MTEMMAAIRKEKCSERDFYKKKSGTGRQVFQPFEKKG